MLFLDNAAPDSCCAERLLHIPKNPCLVSTVATVREKTCGQTNPHLNQPTNRLRSVCLFVCLFVCDYSRTTGYEAAYERYQQLQCYKGKKKNVAILLKPLRSGDMA